MPIWNLSDELLARKQEIINRGYNAYCLYTLPGSELTLANELNNNYEYLIALPIMKMVHRSKGGVKYDSQEPLISSYVFVYLAKEYDMSKIFTSRFRYRLLNKDNDSGKLVGDDLYYAEWILDIDGVISVSQAIKVNGLVKIINGPLKSLEGKIVKYSKKSRNCLIEIEFMNQTISTWLPFDWVDSNL